MTSQGDAELKVDAYFAMHPQEYSLFMWFELLRDGMPGERPFALSARVRLAMASGASELTIEFHGVRQLEISSDWAIDHGLMLVPVAVADRQLEGIAYHVRDDDGAMEFFCTDFEPRIITSST